MFVPPSILVGVTLLLAFAARRAYRRYCEDEEDRLLASRHGCQIPPRIINEWPLGIDRLEQIFRAEREWRLMELFLFHFRQTGNTLRQVFLGTEAFGTIDPINLECMLSTNFKDYGLGPREAIASPLFGSGIFTQEGAAWKRSRELLRPQFSYKQYENLWVFDEHIDDLIANVRESGPVVDLQPLFFRLTLDTTTAFLFGESVHSLRSAKEVGEQGFANAFNRAQEYICMRFRLLDLYWLIGGPKFWKCCKTVHDFVDAILDRNLSAGKGGAPEERQNRYVFLDAVAENSVDRTALRHQMINILAAGRDTTACLLSWTVWLLVRHPAVLNKLKKEIDDFSIEGQKLSRGDLKRMEYLTNILKESLRLYPPFPVNTRSALRTTVLPIGGGPDRRSPVLIKRGRAVAYSIYALHRRIDLYGDDAEEFRPERWDEPMGLFEDEKASTWGFLPFNGGPRICLGMDFALTEAAFTVVRLLQEFPGLCRPESEPVQKLGREKQGLTVVLSPKYGCKVDIGRKA